jgi:hypothetical protein
MRALAGVAGGVTAVTGLGKGSGKTTFLNALLPAARAAGPVGLFSVGVDGGLKAEGRARAAAVRVEEGDVVLTTDLFARASPARLEVLEAFEGRTVLGRLLLGRALRPGEVTLVGAESVGALGEAVALARREGWAATCLVDGAASRVTQLGSLGDVGFVFTLRVESGSLARSAEGVRALAALARLPVSPEPPPGALRLEGPLTEEVLADLPSPLAALSLADFTKSFLPPRSLLRLLGSSTCSVRRGFRLLGVAASLRDVDAGEWREALGPGVEDLLLPNPYEEAA